MIYPCIEARFFWDQMAGFGLNETEFLHPIWFVSESSFYIIAASHAVINTGGL